MRKLVCFILLCTAAFAQVATEANEGYKTPEGRASVAKGLNDPAREERQKPRDIVDALDLKPGSTVADVGTGTGFMLPYLSHAVGDTGHVVGEDIQNDFLDKAKMKAQLSRLNNIQFVLGTDRDPKLPADTLEGVLVLDVYHHFDYPEAMLEHITNRLARNRLAIFLIAVLPLTMTSPWALQTAVRPGNHARTSRTAPLEWTAPR